MRRLPMSLSLTSVLAMALAVAACDKAGAQAAATSDQAASSSAPVQWDFKSKDPARNPNEANKEAAVPGYNP
jgi:hypothetical protein